MAVPSFVQLAPPLFGLAAMLAVFANRFGQIVLCPLDTLFAAFGMGLKHPSARKHHCAAQNYGAQFTTRQHNVFSYRQLGGRKFTNTALSDKFSGNNGCTEASQLRLVKYPISSKNFSPEHFHAAKTTFTTPRTTSPQGFLKSWKSRDSLRR
jgi:hypothetical protein